MRFRILAKLEKGVTVDGKPVAKERFAIQRRGFFCWVFVVQCSGSLVGDEIFEFYTFEAAHAWIVKKYGTEAKIDEPWRVG